MSDFRIRYVDEEQKYVRECDCCTAEAPTTIWDAMTSESIEPLTTVRQHLCVFCFKTYIANMHNYPNQHDPAVTKILKETANMNNILLEELRERVKIDRFDRWLDRELDHLGREHDAKSDVETTPAHELNTIEDRIEVLEAVQNVYRSGDPLHIHDV